MRNICIFTSSRAEFGILRKFIIELKKKFQVFLVVSGTHLIKNYGNTVSEIKKNKIKINKLIYYQVKKNNSEEILKNISFLIRNFSDIYKEKKIDITIILGDRYELLAPAIASTFYKIPICHIHGGEKTLSALDDNIRHAISKLSNLHFVASSIYKKRLTQLGEQPKNIHNIGSLILDNINKEKLLTKEQIQKILNFNFKKSNFLVTLHPETHLSKKLNLKNLKILLNSLKLFPNSLFLFTSSNADVLGLEYNSIIKNFCKTNSKNTLFKYSLGSKLYLSFAKLSNGVIGNSSSGVIEIPSLGIRTLNLGQRQCGRVFAKSIISINFNKKKIIDNIKKLVSIKKLKFKNPYYKKNSITRAINILSRFDHKKSLIKNFNDIY